MAESSASEAPHSLASPLVALACLVDFVALQPIPEDFILPEMRHIGRPWKHETLQGYFTLARRFMRVTRRGTVLFTMPRKSHVTTVRRRRRDDNDDAPELEDEPVGTSADLGGDEEVVGTMSLADACALLPVYDLETGEPFLNMAVLARYVTAANPKTKVLGDGTEPILTLSMTAADMEQLAALVLAFGTHSTSRLVYAYRDAKPIRIRTINAAVRDERAKVAAPPPPPQPKADVTAPNNEANAAQHKDPTMDSDDEELAELLFGDGTASRKSGGSSLIAFKPPVVEIDSDDEDLMSVLGIEKTSSMVSKPRSGSEPHKSATIGAESTLESGAAVTETTKLINPFAYGIGVIPRRDTSKDEPDPPFLAAFAHREATAVTSRAVSDFLAQQEAERIAQLPHDITRVHQVLKQARQGVHMIKALGKEAPGLIRELVTAEREKKDAARRPAQPFERLDVRVGGTSSSRGPSATTSALYGSIAPASKFS